VHPNFQLPSLVKSNKKNTKTLLVEGGPFLSIDEGIGHIRTNSMDRCYNFLNISAKKLAFFTQNKAKLCKNFSITLVFEKTPIF
jgi:hypothetical protein